MSTNGLTLGAARPSTCVSRRASIERAIDLMRTDVGEPHRLAVLAKAAAMSEYHFTRVFHDSTGLPPLRYLSALRLAKACDMLLSTDATVLEICLEVGYSSIGTFTRRFTKLVGLSPTRLRQCARTRTLPAMPRRRATGVVVRVRLRHPHQAFSGRALVAAFRSPFPFGGPAAYAVATDGASVTLTDLARGQYYLQAFARLGCAEVGTGPVSLFISGVTEERDVEIVWRQIQPTDPPRLSFVPLIMQREADGA